VRQLRLRDIGGIIVIDFIDMANPKNRAAVEEALRTELERDRTKTYVVEISPLGLVEMTRQNVTDGPREVMTKKCPTCGGDGIVTSEYTIAVDIERKLRSLVTPGSRSKAFRVEVSARVAWLLAGPGGERLRELEDTTKRRFFLVGKENEHLDHFLVLDQGTLEKVAPNAALEPGQDVDVKLGEVGLHDQHAGVGKVGEMDVAVGNAAKLVGKKVRARITAVGDGIAWAELLSPVDQAEPPLTAEAEAERPTRAPRKAKAEAEEPEAEAEEVEEETEEEAEAVATESGAPVKKKTRRGSRGGRNRKKKTATAASANGAEPEGVSDTEPVSDTVSEEPEPSEGPVIHVPERMEDGDGAEPATQKKKTRRGSRGGRNRKKKTATAVTDAPATQAEPATNGAGDADWEYTPMSEWDIRDE
jgi:ribonuclease G